MCLPGDKSFPDEVRAPIGVIIVVNLTPIVKVLNLVHADRRENGR
jgi:hypothetical protein